MKCKVSTPIAKMQPYSHESQLQAARRLALAVEEAHSALPRTPDGGKGLPLKLVFFAYGDVLDREAQIYSGILETKHGPVTLPQNWQITPAGYNLPGENGGKVQLKRLDFAPVDRKKQSATLRATADTVREYIRKRPTVTGKELAQIFQGWPAGSLRRLQTEVRVETRKPEKAKKPTPADLVAPVEPQKAQKPESLSVRLTRWVKNQALSKAEQEWGSIDLPALRKQNEQLYNELIQDSKNPRKSFSGRLAEGKRAAKIAREKQREKRK